MKTPSLATSLIIGAIAVTAIALLIILERLVQKRRKGESVGSNSGAKTSGSPDLEPVSSKKDSGKAETEWPRPPPAEDGVSKEWLSFVSDRLEETNPRHSVDESKWALDVVDFLDELKESASSGSEKECEASRVLSDRLVACLTEKNFELIDSDGWNPDKQRAVAVVRNPNTTETIILGKGSTGLSHNGKIIRKQEVKIEMKGN